MARKFAKPWLSAKNVENSTQAYVLLRDLSKIHTKYILKYTVIVDAFIIYIR